MNQMKEIKKHLEKGYEITPVGALHLFDCFRLSARIYELRKEGMEITTRLVKKGEKHYAAYRLVNEL